MADIVAFHAALVRCGFNADTAEEITNQGFDLAVLPTIEEADVDAMIKNVRETRHALGAEAEGEVTFPFLPIKRFKAMRFWAAELVRTGRALVAGSFAGPEIANAIIRLDLEKLREDNRDDDTPKNQRCWMTFPSGRSFGRNGKHSLGESVVQPSVLLLGSFTLMKW
jgi:hypothetical protein